MMMCSICKKNVAVIFITKIVNGKQEPMGLCLECAKKQGIAPIDQLIKQTGMSEGDFENLNNQMMSVFEDMDMDELNDSMPKNDSEDSTNPLLSFMNSAFAGLKGGASEDSQTEEEKGNTQFGQGNKIRTKQKKQEKKRKYLNMYGTNLTDKAANNEIDRIIGRQREIDRVIQILNRRTKNNPCLIGEPGVGKTAIAEGLAVRIIEKNVPTKLFSSEIYLLDLTSVVAGTQFRGQFEARMKAIIKEAQENGNIILVIDEVHNIMGAGEAEGGAMNAANILKPALARGEIQVIGATTLDEYRKHIEKDSALERRFQPVMVDEPSIEESIEIVKGIKDYYEDYHRVRISDKVIEQAVRLSERYITDRFLPDKAIDVIDEAGSRVNLKNKGLVELDALKADLKKVQEEKETAAAEDNYQKAADCKVEECRLLKKIDMLQSMAGTMEIEIEDIAYVIEAWTKIPVQKITEIEAEKLINLEDMLHNRVIGQEKAVESVSRAIRRRRSGFAKKKKPASFIFVGPTGVGKTELARALAVELFGNEEAMIRIDMSEYMEKHTVSKLIGAPPGYVGYEQAGQLTEKVRRNPYSLILMDEIEKAHPDVFNILLQILEDGRLTDSQGRTVNFENTVVIMTSNAGTSLKANGIGFGSEGYNALEGKVMEAIKESFRPEFINRVDEIIVFTELNKEQLRSIVDLMLKEVLDESIQKGISIIIEESVKDYIIEKGYQPKYGARPLRRTIQRHIEDKLAEMYLKGEFRDKKSLRIDLENGEIVIKTIEALEICE